MKKLIMLGALIIGGLTLAGCNTTEKEVVEPIIVENTLPSEGGPFDPIEELKPTHLSIYTTFIRDFMDKYSYEDSEGYMFAISVDGNYYNVFRNENGGVSNSIKHGLTGAVPAVEFKGVYRWDIPLNTEIKVAKKKGEYGYKYTTLELKDISEYDIKLSPVKEGVKTHNIEASLVTY